MIYLFLLRLKWRHKISLRYAVVKKLPLLWYKRGSEDSKCKGLKKGFFFPQTGNIKQMKNVEQFAQLQQQRGSVTIIQRQVGKQELILSGVRGAADLLRA